jgi:2-oxoisovalerate dehydrogenase E1 component
VQLRGASGDGKSGGKLMVEAALSLYRQMLRIRRFELTAQKAYKASEMPGFIHLYIGQEAVAAGVCAHLRREDWITSTHRGHGHAIAKGVPARNVLAELYGRADGASGGRGGSMHIYAYDHGLFGTNGFVGGGLPATTGIGISAKVRKTDQVGVAFFGDGAVNHGAFHESINFAGIQKAPVVFVCENNLYATATALKIATANTDVWTKAAAYGIPGIGVDGNDVEAVHAAMAEAVKRAKSGGGPTLIEAKTYRTVGHQEGDPLTGTYRTQEELDEWKKKDPIQTYRARLIEKYKVATAKLDAIEKAVNDEMQDALEFARKSAQPDPKEANAHVYAIPLHPTDLNFKIPTGSATRTLTYVDAVRDGVAEEMRRDAHIIYMGEGTGERGGSFAHTKNLWAEFGAHRMIDTPIAELGFTGAAVGAAGTGCRAIADLMFIDFGFDAATQIVNQAAKLRYMSNGQVSVPMVVRASWGTIKQTGPHHSGAYHSIWSHIPGLIVVVPSSPIEGKGLMKTALRCSDPVMFLEPKALFSMKQDVPSEEYFIPFGKANILREGEDLTVVSCGALVHKCVEAATKLQGEGVSCEVIDLRTIQPLDVDTIAASVEKTGRLLIVDEGFSMCGLGAEIAAAVNERVFYSLQSPITRVHTDPTAHPFSPAHEAEVIVNVDKVLAAARNCMNGEPTPARRFFGPKLAADTHDGAALPASDGGSVNLDAALTSPQADLADLATPANSNGNGAAHVPSATTAPADGTALRIPNMDLTVTEARIVRVMCTVGDLVTENQELLEIETDKAVTAVEAPATGKLTRLDVKEGDTVAIGQIIGHIT